MRYITAISNATSDAWRTTKTCGATPASFINGPGWLPPLTLIISNSITIRVTRPSIRMALYRWVRFLIWSGRQAASCKSSSACCLRRRLGAAQRPAQYDVCHDACRQYNGGHQKGGGKHIFALHIEQIMGLARDPLHK